MLAYAQSASFVQFIQARYGNQSLRDLLAAYNDGADCASAVERVLPTTLDQLNQTWLRSLQPRPLVLQFFLENGIWVLLLLAGLGVTSLLVLKSPL